MTDPVSYVTDEGIPVKLPSGSTFPVLTSDEVKYVEDRVKQYMTEYKFQNVSDLQDVDRMLIMELLVFRWGHWISLQRDYYGEPIDEGSLRRSVESYSNELRQLKKILGIDKATRTKESGSESVPMYLQNLLVRAKEFGVMRNEQAAKAIELVMQLQSLFTLYTNCDEIERKEQHVTKEDVWEWIEGTLLPEFHAIDDNFRNNQQKFWVRSL